MIYQDSVEEQKYLSGLRKEKDAFERLIREKAVSNLGASVTTAWLLQLTTNLRRKCSFLSISIHERLTTWKAGREQSVLGMRAVRSRRKCHVYVPCLTIRYVDLQLTLGRF